MTIIDEGKTIVVSSSMENTDFYNSFINNRKLDRKYYIFNGKKYNIILGQDILYLIKHRKYISLKNRKYRFLQNKEKNETTIIT